MFAVKPRLYLWPTIGAGVVLAASLTLGSAMYASAAGDNVSLLRIFVWAFIDWSAWAAVLPVAFATARAAPLKRPRAARSVAIVTGVALGAPVIWSAVLTLLCVLLEVICGWLSVPFAAALPEGALPNLGPVERFEAIFVSKAALNVTVFLAALALAYVMHSAELRRQSERMIAAEAARRAEAELQQAHEGAGTALIADGLDSISRIVDTNPEAADAAALTLARMMRAVRDPDGNVNTAGRGAEFAKAHRAFQAILQGCEPPADVRDNVTPARTQNISSGAVVEATLAVGPAMATQLSSR